MKRNNAGFTLIEVLVSMVVLGLIVVPVCSCLLLSTRINASAETILEAKLSVSSAVEELMATGLKEPVAPELPGVDIEIAEVTDEPYYQVKVTSEVARGVSVETYIRKLPTQPAGEEGGAAG